MKSKAMPLFAVCFALLFVNACATKKYVRNRVNERAAPLESRTGELEETSRRNTQEVSRISRDVEDLKQRTGQAQEQADRAASAAEQANTRVTTVEKSVGDLRANLDKYTLQKTVTVLFEAGKSDLLPEAMAALDELASQIKSRNGYLMEIQGFASSEGKIELNEQLSETRSDVVKRYLADKHQLPLFRISIIGFGISRPVADNTTKEGRMQNRRVEVRLFTNNAIGQ
jgi:outer membrane protein OmpA-like peptidoglycan-associated protein